MKIAICGYSGSGKSTTAARLADFFDTPLQYLDKVQFKENWELRDRAEAQKMAEDFLANSAWVIDGNYTEFCQEQRMNDADIIIFMNYSRIRCFVRALKRYFQFRGKVRDSISEGCHEKFDLEFAKWVIWDGRIKPRRQHFRQICETFPKKTVVIRNDRQLRQFFCGLKRKPL